MRIDIMRVPVISTVHLSDAACDFLDDAADDPTSPLTVFRGALGWITLVPEDRGAAAATHADLAPVLHWARRAGYAWLRFDADAPRVMGLPAYRVSHAG